MYLLKKSLSGRRMIFFLLLLNPGLLLSQENISGILKNSETGEPVSGAFLQIDNTYYQAVSDAEGHFNIQGAKGNRHSVTITHLSYKTINKTIEAGQEIVIEMVPQTYLSEEVNIIATRSDTRTSAAFSEIEKQEIEKTNLGQDLPFLLNMTPSAVATSDGGNGVGYTGIRIRGSDGTRINVTINGVPVNDAESHQVYWVDLPDIASSVENIQVQRGIGNSTNGAGAFGGSINILTGKLKTEPFGNIYSSVGSFNTFKNTIEFGSGLISESFAIDGRLSKISSEGYIDRAASDLHSLYLSGGYYGKTNSLRAVVFSGKEKTYQAWYGVPGDSMNTNRTYNPAGEFYDKSGNIQYYDNQTDNYRQDYYQLIYSQEINKSITGNFALHYTRGKGYYEEYKPGESPEDYNLSPITIGDSTITQMDLIRQKWLSNHFYGFTWSLDYENKKLNIKTGGAANWYSGKHYGELIASEIMPVQQYPFQYYNNDADKNELNVYIRALYSPDEKLNFWLDIQERIINYSFQGFNDDYLNSQQNVRMNFFNPKAGLSYLINKNTRVFFTAGVGQQEPVRDDFVNSTPSSRPESEYLIDCETGMSYNSGGLILSANLFYMNYKNQLILNGKINDVGEYVRENVNNSYRAGIECEAVYVFSSRINLKANLSISRNKIKLYEEYVDDYDGGPQIINEYNNSSISFSPEVTGAAIISFIPLRNFMIDLTCKYVGKQYLDNTQNESRKLDPYYTNDIHLYYKLNPGKVKELSLQFSVNNVFNQQYSSNGYSYSGFSGGIRYDYNFYFPQAGVYWMGGVVVKI